MKRKAGDQMQRSNQSAKHKNVNLLGELLIKRIDESRSNNKENSLRIYSFILIVI